MTFSEEVYQFLIVCSCWLPNRESSFLEFIAYQEFGEDVSAAVSLGAAKASAIFRSSLSTLRLSSLSKKQETTEEEAPDSGGWLWPKHGTWEFFPVAPLYCKDFNIQESPSRSHERIRMSLNKLSNGELNKSFLGMLMIQLLAWRCSMSWSNRECSSMCRGQEVVREGRGCRGGGSGRLQGHPVCSLAAHWRPRPSSHLPAQQICTGPPWLCAPGGKSLLVTKLMSPLAVFMKAELYKLNLHETRIRFWSTPEGCIFVLELRFWAVWSARYYLILWHAILHLLSCIMPSSTESARHERESALPKALPGRFGQILSIQQWWPFSSAEGPHIWYTQLSLQSSGLHAYYVHLSNQLFGTVIMIEPKVLHSAVWNHREPMVECHE